MADAEKPELTTLTVTLLSAYVSNNSVASENLAELIKSTHVALTGLDAPDAVAADEQDYRPATTARKSLSSKDHILSMIDGKPYKMLKRHLKGHGLTPAEYRERYKLPRDYPMVAPTYAAQRREVAAKIGLGRRPANKDAAPVPAITAAPELEVQTAVAASPAPAAKPPRKSAAAPRNAASVKAKTAPVAKVGKPAKAAAVRKKPAITTPAPSETASIEAPIVAPAKPKRVKLAIATGDGSKATRASRKPKGAVATTPSA